MTWNDDARNHLESRLLQVRRGLGPDDGDPDEVVADCRRHVEAALLGINPVDVAAVDAAFARLGPVGGATPVPAPVTDPGTGEAPRGFLWWFLVVVLPALALGMGLLLDMVELIPSPLHALLIAMVPATGVLDALRPGGRLRPLRALRGMALGTSVYYAIALAPTFPIAVIGILAIGLGLLMLAPVGSAVVLLNTTLRDRSAPGIRPWTVLWAGFAVMVLAGFDARGVYTMAQLDEARDPAARPAVAARLAVWGDPGMVEDILEPSGRWRSGPVIRTGWSGTWGMGESDGPSQEVAAEVLFRMTGRIRQGSGRSVWWDELRGRQTVGPAIHGLRAQESRIDGSLDGDAGLAYLEWSWVFANDGSQAQEARCELVLPPEGAVSRLTLWVDGVPREAAVGSRAQTIAAYQQVAVREQRDPALVTTLGGDRVLLQVFPVPAKGTLRVRLGITAPMPLAPDRARARLLLPVVAHHNLESLAERQPVWLAAKGGVGPVGAIPAVDWRGEAPLGSSVLLEAGRSATVAAAWTPDERGAVVQTWRDPEPAPVTVVIEAGAALAPSADVLRRDLARSLPAARIQFIQDEPVTDGTPFRGGHDGSGAVATAVADAGSGGTVVWIHGPQPIGRRGQDLRMALDRAGGRLVEVAVAPGPVVALQATDGAGGTRSLRVAGDQVAAMIATLPGIGPVPVAERRGTAMPPDDAVRTSDHLVRLEALDRIRTLLAGMQPDRATAQALAQHHRLVTPVSGLVVLETRAQEIAQGLTPGDGAVPSIPEPETWALLAVALAALATFAWRQRRRTA